MDKEYITVDNTQKTLALLRYMYKKLGLYPIRCVKRLNSKHLLLISCDVASYNTVQRNLPYLRKL